MPLLNLADADTSGFPVLPSGVYDAEVYEAKMVETQGGPDAKLPEGTPQVNVQFKLIGKDGVPFEEGEEGYNRRAFTRFTIPPENYDKAKAARMKGMLVRFLLNLGYEESEVIKDDFDLNLEELGGMPIKVVLGQKPKYGGEEGELDNEVKGTKPIGENVAPAGGLL